MDLRHNTMMNTHHLMCISKMSKDGGNKMVKFTTVNVDGETVSRSFSNIEEMRMDWQNEDGTTLPSLDDKLVEASLDNIQFVGNIFNDFATFIALDRKAV